MAHQYLNDGEEEEARARPADEHEPERHEGSHEDVPAEGASGGGDEPVSAHAVSNRQRRDKSEDAPELQADAEPEDSIDDEESEDDDLRKLEAQGFTEDEVNRLVELSDRLNGATLKRLQFTKWLVDQGLLDEFSVRAE